MKIQNENTPESGYEQIEIPEGIISFLENESGISKLKYPNTYSVSTLVNCLRKSYYKKSYNKNGKAYDDSVVEKLWPTVRGNLLHQITRAYKWHELDMEYDIPLGNGKIATVSGRLDMYDWRNKTIIDLKTTKDILSQAEKNIIPRQEHIVQIQCYGTIFSDVIPIENLVLVYADLNNMLSYKIVNEDKTWWMRDRILEIEKSITKNQPPIREISKLCYFCNYQNQCKPDIEKKLISEHIQSKLNMNKAGGKLVN